MKRETVIAIVLGILLGVGIGLFVLFQSNSGEQTKVIPVSGESESGTVVTNVQRNEELVLNISEPVDNLVTNKDEITIKGKVQKGSLIVIQSQINSKVIKNDKEDFSISFPLALGENTISVNAYSQSSTPQEALLKIYYVEE